MSSGNELKGVSNCQWHATHTEIHEHLYQETDHNVREFGPKKIRQTPISDNRVDSTQKSNIDIDICFQLKNQPNKFSFLKLHFSNSKPVQDQKSNVIATLDESSSFLFIHVTN